VGNRGAMRVMFVSYLGLIVVGLVLYTVVGVSHH
jgi:hypothetical protein